MKVTESGNITVSLTTSSKANGVTLRIIDTGPGIDPKFASKLFQPFSKADSFNPGAGLGLYITKALAERMLGTISLYSTPGSQGATFEVNLPVALGSPIDKDAGEAKIVRHEIDMVAAEKYHGRSGRPPTAEPVSQDGSSNQAQNRKAETPDPTSPKVAIEPAPLSAHESLRVLVVDDNDISRKILLALLRKMTKKIPIETAQATDGLEAVAAFHPFHPHLVLTDVSMPHMDGIAASTEMRKLERTHGWDRCRIYAITGLGSSDPRLKAAALRDDILDGWIVKGKDGLTGIRRIVEDVDQLRGGLVPGNDPKGEETAGEGGSESADMATNDTMDGPCPATESLPAPPATTPDHPSTRPGQVPHAISDDLGARRDSAVSDGTTSSGRKRRLSSVGTP